MLQPRDAAIPAPRSVRTSTCWWPRRKVATPRSPIGTTPAVTPPRLADLAILPYADQVMNLGVEAPADDKPNVQAWFERIAMWDSYRLAVLDVLSESQREAIGARRAAA